MLRIDSKESVACGYYHVCYEVNCRVPDIYPIPSRTLSAQRRPPRLYFDQADGRACRLGILAALIAPNGLDRADDTRLTAVKTDINNIVQTLKL